MRVVKPVVFESVVGKNLDCFVDRDIYRQCCDVVRNEDVTFICKLVLNFLSKHEDVIHCVDFDLAM